MNVSTTEYLTFESIQNFDDEALKNIKDVSHLATEQPDVISQLQQQAIYRRDQATANQIYNLIIESLIKLSDDELIDIDTTKLTKVTEDERLALIC